MKVALYTRVSSEAQDTDLSISAQLKALREYAQKNGHEIVSEFKDEAKSGRTADRPDFIQMISLAKTKQPPFEAILVWKLNRFSRNRYDSILYKALLTKRGIQVISINEPIDDSPTGRLLEGILEALDQFYSENLAQDVVRGMKQNAEKGFCNGGPSPHGYKKVKVIDGNVERLKLDVQPPEVPVINRIRELALTGVGAKQITKVLNQEGFRTRSNKLWSNTTICNIICNEVYTGTMIWRSPNGEIIRYPNAHPALISQSDFDKIQQMIKIRQSQNNHPRTVNSQYLLSSMLFCRKCGSPMIGCSAKSGKFFYYRCNRALKHDPKACTCGWLPKDKIESFVIRKIKEKILNEHNVKNLVNLINDEIGARCRENKARLFEIETQLKSTDNSLNKYFLAFEKGTLAAEDCSVRVRELRLQHDHYEKLQRQIQVEIDSDSPYLVNASHVIEYTKDLHEVLSEGDLIEQKSFLKSFIKRVDFEPNKVAVSYTIPVIVGRKRIDTEEEVLSTEPNGGR
jgi:site-specific DNA recombinase